jgi:phosphoadenosine phosphosulfate reductase
LVARGYLSISCAACTTIVGPDEDPRAGRWRGFEKTECGIHRPTANPTGK